jgi:dTDP-4-amino-4,6-dideoxygalactose transaminase
LRRLENTTVEPPREDAYGKHVYHLYVIRCKERDRLQKFLAEKGVQTLIHYPIPLHMQEAFRSAEKAEGSFPVVERAAGEILSLPMYPGLSDDSVQYVCASITEFYNQ